MKKAFTLAETLITMAIIGVIMALSIPAVIQSTNDTRPLFKKAYNTVEQVVAELINDTALYPAGEFDASNSFCNNFFTKLNTIGYDSDNCLNTFVSVIPVGDAGTPNATTTNAMAWYNVDEDFTAAQCVGSGLSGNCLKISVDVNGVNKGAQSNTASAANKDVFDIYVNTTGKVTVAAGSDEATLLND